MDRFVLNFKGKKTQGFPEILGVFLFGSSAVCISNNCQLTGCWPKPCSALCQLREMSGYDKHTMEWLRHYQHPLPALPCERDRRRSCEELRKFRLMPLLCSEKWKLRGGHCELCLYMCKPNAEFSSCLGRNCWRIFSMLPLVRMNVEEKTEIWI